MNQIPKNKRIPNLLLVIASTLVYFGWVVVDFFTYHNVPDKPGAGDSSAITTLIVFITFGVVFLAGYLVNFFFIKSLGAYRVMNFLSSNTLTFLLASIGINLVVFDSRWSFDANNTSLFISSSFSLLGFGLTATAILIPFLVGRFKEALDKDKLGNPFLGIVVSYSLLFFLGLIYSLASLMNAQTMGTAFYRIVVFRALFYSGAQILLIVIQLITHFVAMVIGKPEDEHNKD